MRSADDEIRRRIKNPAHATCGCDYRYRGVLPALTRSIRNGDSMLPLCSACVAILLVSALTLSSQPIYHDSSATHLPATMFEPGMDVEAADIDQDGDLDIIIANEFQPNVILINDGNGHFANESVARLPQPRHDSEDIAVEDFDGDGDLDIVFVSEDDKVHEYYLNDGKGYFESVEGLLPPSEANAVVSADVTGDGFPDLFIGNVGQDFALINDGNGGFMDETLTRLPKEDRRNQDLELLDIDRDGDLDMVAGNEDGNALLINSGDGRFINETATRLPITADMETRKVVWGDVDGDDDPDIIFINVAWNVVKDGQNRIYINDGKGHFADETSQRLPQENESTIDGKLVDIDQDGDLDLISVSFPSGPVRFFLNDGAGMFAEATSSVITNSPVLQGLGIEPCDLNGDGLLDLYICNRAGRDRLLIHASAGASSVGESYLLPERMNLSSGR
jgi:hypothetical protein